MPKVIYETPALQFEVQREVQGENHFANGRVETVSVAWEPVERFSRQVAAVEAAQILQYRNTLEKYRVVDTFAAQGDVQDG